MSSVAEAFVTVRPDMRRFGPMLGAGLAGVAGIAAGAAAVIGAAFTAVAIDGVRQFASFERQMNEVFTLLPGISERAMGQMQDDVRALSVEIGITTDEMVPALYQAISAGVPRENVFDFLRIAGEAAIGGVTDIETAVDGITSVVNAFGEESVDAQQAADLMFTAVRLGKTDFEQLSDRLFQVNPLAAALGVEFRDVTAAMATMTAQGTPTRVAATQLRGMFQELSREGGQAAEIFEDIAGKSFQEFIAAGNDTADAIDILREASEKTGVPLQDMFSTVEGGMAALQLATEDGDAFREALEEMAEAAGATEEAFRTMDTGSARAWERLSIAVHNLRIGIGEQLAPIVERFVEWMVENMPAIEEAVVGAFETIVEWGQEAAQTWRDRLQPALEEFTEAVRDNWPTIKSIFDSLGEIVRDVASIFGSEMRQMSDDTDGATGSMAESVEGLAHGLDVFAQNTSRVTGAVSSSWNLLTGLILIDTGRIEQGLNDLTGGGYSRFMDGTRATARTVTEMWRGFVNDVVEWFRALPGRIIAALSGLGADLAVAGSSAVGDFIGGMTSRLPDVRGAVGRIVQSARDFFPSSPAKEGPFSGQGAPELLGKDLARQFAEGMGSASIGRLVEPTVAELQSMMAVGRGLSSAGSVADGLPIQVHTSIVLDGEKLGQADSVHRGMSAANAKRARLTAGSGL